jgi:multifunctional 2-oxoglutarate metabolism enzyme
MKRKAQKPLIVMAPKSLLRHPRVVSAPVDFTQGSVSELIPAVTDPKAAQRLIFCSGKVYYDVLQALEKDKKVAGKIAVARLEQFYPFPADAVRKELKRYKKVKEVVWLQEEPANMGGGFFVRPLMDDMLEDLHGDCSRRVRYIGRPASASPASGSATVHARRQETLLTDAVTLEP